MSMYCSTNRDLASRGLATGVPQNIVFDFVDLFLKWKECSGEEWTVSRLKTYKLDLIREHAGLPPVSQWIAKCSKKPRFSRTLGLLQKWMRLSSSNFAKGIQLVQIYTTLYASRVTKKQKEKFITGVQSVLPQRGLSQARKALNRGCFLSGLRPIVGTLPPARTILDMSVSPTRRGPTLLGSCDEEASLIDSTLYLLDTVEGWNHYIKFKDYYSPVLKDVLPYDVLRKGMRTPSQCLGSLHVGRVGLIQEPGYKLRAIANPGRVFQRVLEPLGDSIYSLLTHMPWDCTFSQEKALPFLQSSLAAGRTVSSIDLTGATDYFPLLLQEEVLRWLFPNDPLLMDLFHEVCTGTWLMPGYGHLSWTKGQPLGLYPSFGSFALTHGLLLLGILGKEYNHEFFILGDDVVILDTRLANKYMHILSILGCPYSDSKTIKSAQLCEFAGKIVTSTEVIPQLKWRLCSDDSFIDVVRLLGPRAVRLLRPQQRKVISAIAEVPEFLGGLGWNPKGKPLEDRMNQPWIFVEEYKPQSRVTGLSRERISKLMRSSLVQSGIQNLSSKGFEVQYLLPDDDLEQRSLSLTESHIPRLWPWHMLLGKNLDLVFHDLNKGLDLPKGVRLGSSRPSTLDVWKKRLGLQVGKS